MTHLKHVSTITTAILIALFAIPAFAQTLIDVSATSDVEVTTPLPSAKPLDAIKARAGEIKQKAMKAPADRAASSTRPTPIRDRIETVRMNLKQAVHQHAGLVRERFTNVITHLTKIMARVESRIEKLKAAGVDVSAPESLQVSAEASIDTAEADIAAVRAYIESVGEGSDRATVKAELEVKIKVARESIRLAHEAVRKVVKSLVDLAKENRPNATIEVDASIE